jgi:diadenosine tetraphosphatase ApaH/serine/threonine PP2A family protein phosphatase
LIGEFAKAKLQEIDDLELFDSFIQEDDMKIYDWFPQKGEIILLGHTHYPILKNVDNGGIIINPGSVGQSRDGNLSSSFCILDTLSLEINFYRVPYDTEKVISELLEMKWYPRAVNSLKKCNG